VLGMTNKITEGIKYEFVNITMAVTFSFIFLNKGKDDEC
jgi:hypothetical protein